MLMLVVIDSPEAPALNWLWSTFRHLLGTFVVKDNGIHSKEAEAQGRHIYIMLVFTARVN